jgi:hypothetical protein
VTLTWRELTASLGKVNATVNRIRRLKNRLSVLAGGSEGENGLAAKAKAVAEKLTAVEAVLVDVSRESHRDVLRNPAGLNDTLLALISTVSVSDTAPTTPGTHAVGPITTKTIIAVSTPTLSATRPKATRCRMGYAR